MELQETVALQAKNLISQAKNIYLVPSNDAEAISCVLALFYTLKQQGKNVNLLIEDFPNNLKFLSPSLDFISYPKNFVISIPSSVASISQIYYEKNDDALKIHLALENGTIKKDNVAFYFSEKKPDLIITLGIKDYMKELSEKLNSFGFLLDSPIINIDNSKDNQNFGKINLTTIKPLSETIIGLTEAQNKESAGCLLTGLVVYTENFKKNVTAEIFQMSADLMKQGASLEEILNNIFKT